jgi:Family of unknown function (DUF5719)
VTSNAPERRRRRLRPRRAAALVLVAGGLVALGAWSVGTRATTNPAPGTFGVTSVAPLDAESSAFTCPGLWLGPPVPSLELELTNVGASTRHATIELVDSAQEHATRLVALAAGATTLVPVGGWVPTGRDGAAFVTIDGGGVGVAETSALPDGVQATPCASSSATHWYFAGGATQDGDSATVSIANPTSTSAVANLTFTTPQGLVVPGPGQGIVLAPHAVAAFAATSLVPHLDAVGATVVATKGSVVASIERTRSSPGGDSVALGAPGIARRLLAPGMVASAGATMTLAVSNPTTTPQQVVVSARIASGLLAPWTQSVPAGSLWTLVVSPSSRVPLTGTFSLSVTASGPGVAADLELLASRASAGGLADVVLDDGASFAAGRWLLPAAASAPSGLVLAATGPATTASILRLSPRGAVAVAGLDQVALAPGRSTSASTRQLARLVGRSLLVVADGPLATAERLAGGALPDGVTTLYAEPIRPGG